MRERERVRKREYKSADASIQKRPTAASSTFRSKCLFLSRSSLFEIRVSGFLVTDVYIAVVVVVVVVVVAVVAVVVVVGNIVVVAVAVNVVCR